jgi:hypothetical protein
MYRAGARTARIAARSTRTAADPGIRIRTGADGKDRQLFFESLAVASRAGGLMALPRQILEAVAAVAAGELEQRHTVHYGVIGV